MNKEVVIIIPTLNEESFIEECLGSLYYQTFPFEKMDVMVVDGGSKDRTIEIVKCLQSEWHNVRLISNPKRIQSAAFNLGVKNSDAPFIIRLDAHVTYDKRYVELCIKHLKANHTYGNVGGICIIKAKKETLIANTNMILNQSLFGIGGSKFRVGSKAACVDTVPFGAFRREVIEKVGGMREDMPRAEDNEFNSRIHKYGYKVFLDPEIVSTYYARGTFLGSIRQMYNNGDSIGHLLYVDRSAIGLRHFVPFVFVSGIICGIICGFIYTPFWYLLCAGVGLYFVLNIIATFFECKKFGWKYFCVLPIFFFSVHISYGVGTIIGVLKHREH